MDPPLGDCFRIPTDSDDFPCRSRRDELGRTFGMKMIEFRKIGFYFTPYAIVEWIAGLRFHQQSLNLFVKGL